jgi:hypothetical protein
LHLRKFSAGKKEVQYNVREESAEDTVEEKRMISG